MEPCNNRTCGSHHPGWPNNCKAGPIEECGFHKPLISETNGGAEVPCNVGLSCMPLIKHFIKSRMDMKPLLEADDKKYQQGRREELAIIFLELVKMENAR